MGIVGKCLWVYGYQFVDKGLVLTRVGLWLLVVLFETLN